MALQWWHSSLVFCAILPILISGVPQKNVYGDSMAICSTDPLTGWHRDGYCNTDRRDGGSHVVCAEMTAEFLSYTRARGNDLSTPHPPGFPGLNPGDYWCLCATRWREALDAGVAPRVRVAATHESALRFRGINLETLEANASGASASASAASGSSCPSVGCPPKGVKDR